MEEILESQPLLRQISAPRAPTINDPSVEFDPNGDADNPQEWSNGYKNAILSLLAMMSFTVTFTCISLVPIANQIILDLEGREDRSSAILLVTVWELGEAIGPLLFAPLSELFGRYPIFNIGNIVFIFGILLAAVSQTANLFIFARFLTGMAVVSNVLNPAIVGDIFPSERRGKGMSIISLLPLIGGAIGPAASGILAEKLGWRTILWMSAAVAIICETLFFLFFRETYKVTILQKRAARLRRENEDESLKCAWEEDATATARFRSSLKTSIKRPAVMMWDSSVLKIMSFYGAVSFCLYYVLATSLPNILEKYYSFSPALIGYSFLTFSTGATLAIILNAYFSDKVFTALGEGRGKPQHPEYRLPLLIACAAVIPLTVVMYGLVPDFQWPVWLLLLDVGVLGFLLLLISVSLQLYITDAFGIYSASAMTGVLVTRCLGGTVLPLTIPPLTKALGLGGGFLVPAGICLVLIPLPIVVLRYGPIWRQGSEFTKDEKAQSAEALE